MYGYVESIFSSSLIFEEEEVRSEKGIGHISRK